jgi:DNA-binding transcriptional LysR family regulator
VCLLIGVQLSLHQELIQPFNPYCPKEGIMMNLDFYRNFVKIVECGTLSATARYLHVAQSALSSQVKQFEEEYHSQLFIRNARHMEPTEAGKILYEKAKHMILLEDAAHKEIQAYEEGTQGTVRVGMTQAYPDTNMTKIFLKFRKENPQIRFAIYEMNSNEIVGLLRSGVIEIGIIRTADLLPADLEEAITTRERLSVYCGYNNPWISPYEKEVSLSLLEQVPIAISRGFSETLQFIFERANIHPVIMSISTSRSNAMMWGREKEAVAIICAGEKETLDDAESFCRSLASADPAVARKLNTTRSFVVLKDRTLSAATKKFILFSKHHFYGN